MAITLKKITLWRKEVDNKPGALADTLALLAQARTDLQAVIGYRYPETRAKRPSSCIRYGNGADLTEDREVSA